MRRLLVISAFVAILGIATTGCSGNTTVETAPTATSPATSALPAPSPSTSAAEALTAADKAFCETRNKILLDTMTMFMVYGTLINNPNTTTSGYATVVRDLKPKATQYRAVLDNALKQELGPTMKAAMQADMAAIDAGLTALDAAGTDYTGKVNTAIQTIGKAIDARSQVAAACKGN